MLYEFAMTPDVFGATVVERDAALGVILVELLRGMCDNGMIANLHKDRWIRHVREDRVRGLSSGLKDKVITCLNALHDRHRLVRHPRRMAGDPATDNDWLNLALESHGRIPFHGIVLSQALLNASGHNDPVFMELSGALDTPQWQSRRRSRTLIKSETDYRSALAPLLRHAKTLALVDPYMSCRASRFFDTVKVCIDLLGQRGHAVLPARIYIHAGNPERGDHAEPVTHRLNAWERQLRPLIGLHRVKVFLWDMKLGGKDFHDRYILTDQCGVSVPGGLDCRHTFHSSPNDTTWSLLDEEVRIRLLQDFDPVTSPYRLMGEREVG